MRYNVTYIYIYMYVVYAYVYIYICVPGRDRLGTTPLPGPFGATVEKHDLHHLAAGVVKKTNCPDNFDMDVQLSGGLFPLSVDTCVYIHIYIYIHI